MSNIKSIKYIGRHQTYDLEVDHPDHQFYLSNGVLTSNSHAVTYSFLSYDTAYLKAHFPLEFLLANLVNELSSNKPDAESNVAKYKNEIRKLNIKILPPNVNDSQHSYHIIDDSTLITGLDAMKFIGDEAIREIILKRPFKSFFDFMVRCDSKAVAAGSIKALAATGCLDFLGIGRKLIYLYCSDYRKKLQVWLKKHDPKVEEMSYPWPTEPDWSLPEKYALEKHYLGEAFICGKKDAYGSFFNDPSTSPIKYIVTCENRTTIASVKAEIKDVFVFRVKKEGSKLFGKEMAKMIVEDVDGDRCSITIFPDSLALMKDRLRAVSKKLKLEEGLAMHFSGSVNHYEDDVGIILDNVYSFAPSPALPEDLKSRKVAIKRAKTLKVEKKIENKDDLFSDIEDELIEEGSMDPDED